MKENVLRDINDKQFIKAVDVIFEVNRKIGDLKFIKDISISNLISKNNRSLVQGVRQGKRRIPANALMQFALHFKISMDYFLDAHATFVYKGFNSGDVLVSILNTPTIPTGEEAKSTSPIHSSIKNAKENKEIQEIAPSYRADPKADRHIELGKELEYYKKGLAKLTTELPEEYKTTLVSNCSDVLYHLLYEREQARSEADKLQEESNKKAKEVKRLSVQVFELSKELTNAKDEVIAAKDREIETLKKLLD